MSSGQTITNYASLVQAIQDWLSRSDITDANWTPELIQVAEANVYNGYVDNKGNYWPGLRVRQMEKAIPGGSVISASNNFAVPSDYLDMKYLYITASGGQTVRLERKPAEWMYQYWGGSSPGTPTYFARDGSVFIFGPTADSQYALNGIYYAQSAPLSSTNTTDWMVTNYPNLVLAASLAEVSAFVRDEMGTQYWQAKMTNLMATIMQQDRRERFSGSPLAMAPG